MPQNPGPAPDVSGLNDLMHVDEAEEAREPVDWDARTAEALASGDAKEIETRRTTRARQRTGAARKVRQIQQLGVSIEKFKKEKRTAEQFIFGHAKILMDQHLMDQQLFSYIEHISKAPKGSRIMFNDLMKQMVKRDEADTEIMDKTTKRTQAQIGLAQAQNQQVDEEQPEDAENIYDNAHLRQRTDGGNWRRSLQPGGPRGSAELSVAAPAAGGFLGVLDLHQHQPSDRCELRQLPNPQGRLSHQCASVRCRSLPRLQGAGLRPVQG